MKKNIILMLIALNFCGTMQASSSLRALATKYFPSWFRQTWITPSQISVPRFNEINTDEDYREYLHEKRQIQAEAAKILNAQPNPYTMSAAELMTNREKIQESMINNYHGTQPSAWASDQQKLHYTINKNLYHVYEKALHIEKNK